MEIDTLKCIISSDIVQTVIHTQQLVKHMIETNCMYAAHPSLRGMHLCANVMSPIKVVLKRIMAGWLLIASSKEVPKWLLSLILAVIIGMHFVFLFDSRAIVLFPGICIGEYFVCFCHL
jgi:hypothetical protein